MTECCCVCRKSGGVSGKIPKMSRNYLTCKLRKNKDGTFVHEGECEEHYKKLKHLYQREVK